MGALHPTMASPTYAFSSHNARDTLTFGGIAGIAEPCSPFGPDRGRGSPPPPPPQLCGSSRGPIAPCSAATPPGFLPRQPPCCYDIGSGWLWSPSLHLTLQGGSTALVSAAGNATSQNLGPAQGRGSPPGRNWRSWQPPPPQFLLMGGTTASSVLLPAPTSSPRVHPVSG